MQEPRTGIICDKSDHALLVLVPDGYYVPAHRIDVVERTVASALHDIKVMLESTVNHLESSRIQKCLHHEDELDARGKS